jgi:REP element-mobilizing transposase RayT
MKSKIDPQKHHRRSIRLKSYDYSWTGAYYVTIVTWRRDILFGKIVKREMFLNKAGKAVLAELLELPKRLRYVELGAYVIMPNHVHVIIFIKGEAPHALSNQFIRNALLHNATAKSSSPPHGPKPESLGAIVGQFKSRVTSRLWKLPSLRESPIWQRNYYEHVIRNEVDLKNKTDYIEANPSLWDDDDENPANAKP